MIVKCLANGKQFKDLESAAEWARQENGTTITGISILRSCCGIQKTAAGLFWSIDLEHDEIPFYALIDEVEYLADEARKAETKLKYAVNRLYEVLE